MFARVMHRPSGGALRRSSLNQVLQKERAVLSRSGDNPVVKTGRRSSYSRRGETQRRPSHRTWSAAVFGKTGASYARLEGSGNTRAEIAACGAILAAAFAGIYDDIGAEAESTINKNNSIPLGRHFISDAVEKAAPALVNIFVHYVDYRYGGLGGASGSGFFISQDGFIVTNAHVVQNAGSNNLEVTRSDGRKFMGRVHSVDVMSDLALVKIDPPKDEVLPVMKIGRSSSLRVGEWVVALGSPLSLHNSVSAGIVSAVARHSSEIGLTQQNNEYIQTDAAVNTGNSGGPLINLDGEVIGVNALKAASAMGISFAIPIDTAWQVIEQLKTHKKVIRPYIGMKMIDFSPGNKQLYSITRQYPDIKEGVIVVSITPGSPAEVAGLKALDVIVEVDGRKVSSTKDILSAIGYGVGRTIPLKVHREGQKKAIQFNVVTEKLR